MTTEVTANPVAGIGDAVANVADHLPELLEACTDPQATDMAELLYELQQARIALQAVERDVETATAKAMLGDQALTDTLRVERHRTSDRKTWDHDGWQREARAKVLQAHGLKGAQAVIDANGEALPASVLYDVAAALQAVHGSTGPRVTALRELGLDSRDYCEQTPGRWTVKVQRIAAEDGEGDQ